MRSAVVSISTQRPRNADGCNLWTSVFNAVADAFLEGNRLHTSYFLIREERRELLPYCCR